MKISELKQEKIWVCWRYEKVKGRLTKVLYNTKGYKTGTSDEYRSQWVTFDEANEAVKLYNYDGIGLILIPSIGGIDIRVKIVDLLKKSILL